LPRFDYDAVTLLPKGLLIEETRANLLLRSSEFNISPWVLGVITPDTAIAPDGTLTADTITFSGAGQYLLQNVAITLGVAYTISFYIRTVTGTSNIKLVNDGGASVSSNIPVTDQWTRITFTSTSSRTGSAGHGLEAAGASSFYIWGAQLEAGAFATSYIPTTTTSLTRNADQVAMTGTNFSSWYSQTEGAFAFFGDTITPNATKMALNINDGSTANRLDYWFVNGSLGLGRFTSIVSNATAADSGNSGTPAVVGNTAYGICAAYKQNSFAWSFNANTPGSTSSGNLPVVDRMDIGNRVGFVFLNGHARKIMYWPQRIVNAEVQAFSKG
jgi:hypothetical protein